MPEIILTFDTDWAPSHILDQTVSILKEYCVPATFFVTEKPSNELMDFEVGIHPLFQDMDLEVGLRNALTWYPDAVSVRSHRLLTTAPLYSMYRKLGLLYESNYIIYGRPVDPFRMLAGIWQFPIYFGDSYYLHTLSGGDIPSRNTLEVPSDCPLVFNFHPIHIYLNTERLERYAKAKSLGVSATELDGLVNTKARGIRDILLELLDAGKKSGWRFYDIRTYGSSLSSTS